MIREFNIMPLVSVGEIMFNMKRDKVRSILGEYSTYRNRPNDVNTADCFDICQAFYSADDEIEFIMFHELKKVKLIWEGKILNEMSKKDLITYFSNLDPNLEIEEGNVGIESNRFGVACYFVSDIEIDDYGNEIETEKVETISFAVENFWK